MKSNTANRVINKKPTVMVSLTDKQVSSIKKEIIENKNTYSALYFANIHYNTFQKALKGNPIKQEQRDKLMEYCDMVKQAKAA